MNGIQSAGELKRLKAVIAAQEGRINALAESSASIVTLRAKHENETKLVRTERDQAVAQLHKTSSMVDFACERMKDVGAITLLDAFKLIED